MNEQATEAPTLEDLAKFALAPAWSDWGRVYDRQATVSVISALQRKGLRVRVVKEAAANRIYVQRPA